MSNGPDNTRSEYIRDLINNIRHYGKEHCFSCKGDRLLCNSKSCPILKRTILPATVDTGFERDMSGPSSSLFIDWLGYPEVTLGPTLARNQSHAELTASPAKWYGYSLDQLLELISGSVLASTTHDISTSNNFIEYLQELALSIRPVDVEMRFRQKPEPSLRFSSVHEPLGPKGELEYFKLIGNPTIPKAVDNEISDNTKPAEAIWNLYNDGFDVYYLQRLYSAGIFNKSHDSKLVPSSWAIRAVDKHIGNCLVNQLENMEPLDEFLHYSISYLSSKYEILMLPGDWRFEFFEGWAPETLWTLAYARPAIYQNFEGYTIGSEDMGVSSGSYHAVRLAVLENLKKLWKYGTVIVFREVANDYRLPLGVWHVREAVRNAFKNKPSRFGSAEAAFNYVSVRLQTPISEYSRYGVILRDNT